MDRGRVACIVANGVIIIHVSMVTRTTDILEGRKSIMRRRKTFKTASYRYTHVRPATAILWLAIISSAQSLAILWLVYA